MADFLIELVNEYKSNFAKFTDKEAKEFKNEILSIAKDMKRDISHLFDDIKKSATPPAVKKSPVKKVAVKTTPAPKKTAPTQKNEAVKSPTKPEFVKLDITNAHIFDFGDYYNLKLPIERKPNRVWGGDYPVYIPSFIKISDFEKIKNNLENGYFNLKYYTPEIYDYVDFLYYTKQNELKTEYKGFIVDKKRGYYYIAKIGNYKYGRNPKQGWIGSFICRVLLKDITSLKKPKKTAPTQKNEAVKSPTKPEIKRVKEVAKPVEKSKEVAKETIPENLKRTWNHHKIYKNIGMPIYMVLDELAKSPDFFVDRKRVNDKSDIITFEKKYVNGIGYSDKGKYYLINVNNEELEYFKKRKEFYKKNPNEKSLLDKYAISKNYRNFYDLMIDNYNKKQSTPKVAKEKQSQTAKPNTSKAKLLKGDDTTLETPAEEIPGYYAIMEMDDVIQSHDPVTFDWNKKYPKQCQERDYRKTAEKDKVLSFANNFKPQNLVNDSPEAMSGPPVINPDGVVLGGNGRIMILKRVHKDGKFYVYENYLGKKSQNFGFEENDIKLKFKNPVLVRVVDAPISRCMFYSRLLNESLSREKDGTTNALSMSKSLTENSFIRIANLFENEDNSTFRAVIDDRKNQQTIIEILRKDGIITSSNSPKWLKDGNLTADAKNNLENLLLAKILPSEELIETAKEYTNRIMKAIPVLIKIQQLPKEYNLTPILQDVIKYEARRREQGLSIKQFLNQESMFGDSDMPETITAMLWLALASGVNKFREILESYYNSAKNNISEDSMFGFEPATPTEILSKIVETKGLSDKFQITENAVDSNYIKKGNSVFAFYGKDCKYYYVAGAKFNNGRTSFIDTAMNNFSAYNRKHSANQSKIYKFKNKKQAESRLNSLLLASGYYKNNGVNTQLTLANRPKVKRNSGRTDNYFTKAFYDIRKIIKSNAPLGTKLKKIVKY